MPKHGRSDSSDDGGLNHICMFITGVPGRGTSLYYVTNHWVLRCSGHHDIEHGPDDEEPSDGRRISRTFIRRREIAYEAANGDLAHLPAVGLQPREGGHTGHPILQIVEVASNAAAVPAAWVSVQGVTWATALAEIDAAVEYARRMSGISASRTVGGSFSSD